MGKLYFLAGLPRSGKSTIAKSWANYEINIGKSGLIYSCKQHDEQPRVIVCADDIRISLTGHRFNAYAESMVNTIKKLMIRTLLRKHDVLVDGTHTTKYSIRQILELDDKAIPIFVGTPADVCKSRAVATGQDDLVHVIDRMAANLQDLTNVVYVEQMFLRYYAVVDDMRNHIKKEMVVTNA